MNDLSIGGFCVEISSRVLEIFQLERGGPSRETNFFAQKVDFFTTFLIAL
jgi:hypothetical protein